MCIICTFKFKSQGALDNFKKLNLFLSKKCFELDKQNSSIMLTYNSTFDFENFFNILSNVCMYVKLHKNDFSKLKFTMAIILYGTLDIYI